jgi:hypothetical protein
MSPRTVFKDGLYVLSPSETQPAIIVQRLDVDQISPFIQIVDEGGNIISTIDVSGNSTALSDHILDQTDVHGISDTSKLVRGYGGAKENLQLTTAPGATYNMDLGTGNGQQVILSANTTLAISNSAGAMDANHVYSCLLCVQQAAAGGPYTFTFPASCRFPNGNPGISTVASSLNYYYMVSIDGAAHWDVFPVSGNVIASGVAYAPSTYLTATDVQAVLDSLVTKFRPQTPFFSPMLTPEGMGVAQFNNTGGTVGVANTALFVRCPVYKAGRVRDIQFMPHVLAGNYSVHVWKNTGGSVTKSYESASVAMSGLTIDIWNAVGASDTGVDVALGDDLWLGITFDNATAGFARRTLGVNAQIQLPTAYNVQGTALLAGSKATQTVGAAGTIDFSTLATVNPIALLARVA